MKRRTLLKLFAAGALTPPAMALGASNKKPNFILIYIDDQGWVDSAVRMIKERKDTKSDYFQTPHLKRMAKKGMVDINAR